MESHFWDRLVRVRNRRFGLRFIFSNLPRCNLTTISFMWITTHDSISRGGSRDRNWGLRGIKRCSRHSMIVCIASLARSQLPELFISSCNRFHPFRYSSPHRFWIFQILYVGYVNPVCFDRLSWIYRILIICTISKRIIKKKENDCDYENFEN